MPPVAAASDVPAEHDTLCEGCGYRLNGLPDDSNCPECGKPIAQSLGSARQATRWEQPAPQRRGSRVRAFLSTSASVVFRTTRFYRTLATRRDAHAARSFARIHWIIAALLFALAATLHVSWSYGFGPFTIRMRSFELPLIVLAVAAYAALAGMTALAARLTHWEASYRGLRLPLAVVQRGLYYHAAHYPLVALIAAGTVATFVMLFRADALSVEWYTRYLYLLSAEVIVAALYLFQTYWIGMRNMMYANR